jgi:antitoxin MazE
MKAELIKIGNSQGIRIPKPIIDQCGLKKTVNIEVRDNSLVISSLQQRRRGWDTAFALMHNHNDDQLLDADVIASEFDDSEWMW